MQALLALMHAQRYADAETMARALIVKNADSGLAWKALGVCLRVQRKDALEALRRAVELLPADVEAHGNYANALIDAGRYGEAVAVYQLAIALEPMRATTHNDLGTALRALGALAESEASFRRACELQPDLAVAHNNLGNVLRARGEAEAAIGAYRRAIECLRRGVRGFSARQRTRARLSATRARQRRRNRYSPSACLAPGPRLPSRSSPPTRPHSAPASATSGRTRRCAANANRTGSSTIICN